LIIWLTWLSIIRLISVEDGFDQNDWEGWVLLTEKIGSKCQLVGDDLFVTNVEYLKKGSN